MEYPIKVLILIIVMDRGGAEAMTMNYMRNMDRTKAQYDFQFIAIIKLLMKMNSFRRRNIYRICPIYPQNFQHRYKKKLEGFKEHPEYKNTYCNMSELGYFGI